MYVLVDERLDESRDRGEVGFGSVEPRIPRSRYRAVLGAAAEQQDDVVEVVLRFHVRQDGRISVLLEDRRRAERAVEAMDLVRPDDAAKRVKGVSMPFPSVGQRLEPHLHLPGAVSSTANRALARP